MCGDRFGNQYSWRAFRPGHRITQIYGCASIMSRPATTAGRENNDEPLGPTPALIYLRVLARMQQICLLLPRLLHAKNATTYVTSRSFPTSTHFVVEEKQTKDYNWMFHACAEGNHQIFTTSYFLSTKEKKALLTWLLQHRIQYCYSFLAI